MSYGTTKIVLVIKATWKRENVHHFIIVRVLFCLESLTLARPRDKLYCCCPRITDFFSFRGASIYMDTPFSNGKSMD